MAKPATRQQLIDYCFRKLGAPVLEINVDDDQVDECKTSDVLLLKGGGDRDMGYLLFYRAKK